MKTFRIENLTTEEISAIVTALQFVISRDMIEDKAIKEHFSSALVKTFHPIVVEKAKFLS